jgi:hypothetical protein
VPAVHDAQYAAPSLPVATVAQPVIETVEHVMPPLFWRKRGTVLAVAPAVHETHFFSDERR